ncbi:MAG: hypothetical protein JSR24_01150 [Proteobacteria bacterium]|nr:hypothetical protein [Pseudomonadota bacterium]
MTSIRLFAGLLVTSLALVATTSAMAQATPTRLRGTISAIDDKTVTIATREGTTVKAKLNDNWGVALVAPIPASEIKAGSFVGVASMGSDTDRTALEVLVFPEAARGSNEGHYPWDLQPQSMMTNATVATVAAGGDDQTLKLDYKDKQGATGTQTIKVKPGTPIVTFLPGKKEDAKVGAKVFTGASKADDGTYSTSRLLVGKDGIAPPM